jgi:hypothetical protein
VVGIGHRQGTLASLEVTATTSAPMARANWRGMGPTPPLAPVTRTRFVARWPYAQFGVPGSRIGRIAS